METNTVAYELGYMFGAIVATLVTGGIIAAFPLIIGIKRGKKELGISGAVACFASAVSLGAPGVLLGIILAIIFVVIILIKSRKKHQ